MSLFERIMTHTEGDWMFVAMITQYLYENADDFKEYFDFWRQVLAGKNVVKPEQKLFSEKNLRNRDQVAD